MLRQFAVTSLKDGARVFGLVLPQGTKVAIDVDDSDENVGSLQAAVDMGEVKIEGFKATPGSPALDPVEPAPPPAPKGKGK